MKDQLKHSTLGVYSFKSLILILQEFVEILVPMKQKSINGKIISKIIGDSSKRKNDHGETKSNKTIVAKSNIKNILEQ